MHRSILLETGEMIYHLAFIFSRDQNIYIYNEFIEQPIYAPATEQRIRIPSSPSVSV